MSFDLLNDPRRKIEMAQFSCVIYGYPQRRAIVDTGTYERYEAYNWCLHSGSVHYIDEK